MNLSFYPPRLTSLTPIKKTGLDDSISLPITPPEPESQPSNSDSITYPDPETIDSEVLANHMFTAQDPPLALLIRTSGVKRLSDFMLWQCHENTEIVFLDCLWPDFDLWYFLPVLIEWQWKQKRLGQNTSDIVDKSLKSKNK